ncbi:MAG: FmdB family zinc ribbon protein [Hyphomicrobiales bacterium]
MPTYEYECQSCHAVYDLVQSFSAETTHTCEECGKGVAKRVLHAPRVVFKGSGWYVTDSRKSQSAISDAPSENGSRSESGSESKSESTPGEGSAAAAG